MNKYKVQIRMKNGCPFNVNEIKGALKSPKSRRWVCLRIAGGPVKDGVVAGLHYVTGDEEMAMSVYSKARRNLNPKKYMATLELPGKEDK